MPVKKTAHGGVVFQAGSHVNAYDQWLRYVDGSSAKVVTIVFGDERDGKNRVYVDIDPEVAGRLFTDLETMAYNARKTARDSSAFPEPVDTGPVMSPRRPLVNPAVHVRRHVRRRR